MAEQMLQFVKTDQEMPQKRLKEERAQDFLEIYGEFILEKAKTQSSRCSQCGVPFCQTGCPLQNNIPDWLKLAATGRLEEAYQISAATNPLPEICGRICPQDRLCEQNCVIEQSTHGTVTIGAIERFITETAFANNWVPPIAKGANKSQKVAIIGSGPAGIAAAQSLVGFGYEVTIFDRHDRAGGLLVYGIPGFKLEKEVVTRRIEQLEEAGVTFKLSTEIGKDISFAQLKNEFDAVLIATGVYAARGLGIGEDNQVIQALDYLIASNKIGFGDKVPAFESGQLNAKGKKVVVIGGGDTAMDCVRTAIRQGAKSVTCLYRRDRKNMPGSTREVTNAEEEGVVFEWLRAPKSLVIQGGNIVGVNVAKMRLGERDKADRQSIEEIKGSDHVLDADMVVAALGFEPEELPMTFEHPELALTKWNTVAIDANSGLTSVDGVFSAGDIVRGASLVVWALKDGMEAATNIHNYLREKI
ncbi:MAG: glutamate synthase (NADPH/NADH) small chain [Hyphomonadaceae bacterium]|nr:MAG: glutamate synthase (NADPH/NADH) small chain [Hyphomonadaceae bacterium]KAF0187083.1 MAG: glutamate synthase (NADPH/NADH) small chain [Hyphomonadaceae bacterium]